VDRAEADLVIAVSGELHAPRFDELNDRHLALQSFDLFFGNSRHRHTSMKVRQERSLPKNRVDLYSVSEYGQPRFGKEDVMVWTDLKRATPMTDDEKDFFVKLGERIAELRRARALTQAQVAERFAVSQQTINSFERGRRRVPVSLLPELAQILDVTIEELIVGDKANGAGKRGPASKIERQMEEIRRLPRAKQRFVIEMLDAVIAKAQREAT
jgi:transcriptional regulator with XRE-family HTH domain